MKLMLTFRGMLLLVFLTACSGLFPMPPPTSTLESATETPSLTTVWFPPTDTPTTFTTPTILPTSDQLPGLGDLLFFDSFNQPDLWNISESTWASASITRNRLILSISGQGPVSIASLRSQPSMGDFYAEAAASLSLCGSKDQFGMLFRASPGENYYRFTVRCDGQARLERRLSGSSSPLLDWQPSSDAPIAAPEELKLGIWAVGSEMRFFLNDHLQFTVRDPVLHSGTLGFFAAAGGSSPITVSFSILKVYSVHYSSPTPTTTPSHTSTPSRTPTP
jgi:hypothetical protein